MAFNEFGVTVENVVKATYLIFAYSLEKAILKIENVCFKTRFYQRAIQNPTGLYRQQL